VKTLVKVENDIEVFVTDAEEVDFDKLNEQRVQDIHQLLMTENQGPGVDTEAVVTNDVSA